jgi:hypothetical protein
VRLGWEGDEVENVMSDRRGVGDGDEADILGAGV